MGPLLSMVLKKGKIAEIYISNRAWATPVFGKKKSFSAPC
jgi:hypothetical protein